MDIWRAVNSNETGVRCSHSCIGGLRVLPVALSERHPFARGWKKSHRGQLTKLKVSTFNGGCAPKPTANIARAPDFASANMTDSSNPGNCGGDILSGNIGTGSEVTWSNQRPSTHSCNQIAPSEWAAVLFNLTVSIRVDERHSSGHAIGQMTVRNWQWQLCRLGKSNKPCCRYVVCGDGKFVSPVCLSLHPTAETSCCRWLWLQGTIAVWGGWSVCGACSWMPLSLGSLLVLRLKFVKIRLLCSFWGKGLKFCIGQRTFS